MNLNQVTLPVKNMQESIDFYRKLGFLQIVDTPHYARFSCPDDGTSFSLLLETENYLNGAVIYFEHEKLEEWVAELQLAGITFDQLPTEQSYLWREAVLFDPSGNIPKPLEDASFRTPEKIMFKAPLFINGHSLKK